MTRELPVYVCHKRVRALEIRSIEDGYSSNGEVVRPVICGHPDGPATLTAIGCGEVMFARYTPVPGDFYVVYEDGYQSFSPRKAFLEGYTLALGDNVMMERLNDLATTAAGADLSNTPEWLKELDWSQQIGRVAREAYVTINSLKHQLETIKREKANPNSS